MQALARFDTFRKSKDHVQVRTLSGATGEQQTMCPQRERSVARPATCYQCPLMSARTFVYGHTRYTRQRDAVSLVTSVLVICLFLSEIVWYRTTRIENHLLVDTASVRNGYCIVLRFCFA